MAETISLTASKALLLKSSAKNKQPYPAHKALLEFLEKKHLQYLTNERSKNNTKGKNDTTQSCYAESNFELDTNIFAEHLVQRAKMNLRMIKKKKSLNCNSNFMQHQNRQVLSSTVLLKQSQSRFVKPAIDKDYNGQTTQTHVYRSTLYQQIEKEWKSAIVHQRHVQNANTKHVSNFSRSSTSHNQLPDKRAVMKEPLVTPTSVPNSINIPNIETSDKITPFKESRPLSRTNTFSSRRSSRPDTCNSTRIPNSLPGKPTTKNKAITGPVHEPTKNAASAAESEEIRQKFLLKLKQRAEIYALNKIMKDLEEENFKEATEHKI